MKRLLLLLLLAVLPTLYAGSTPATQEKALNPFLWQVQTRLGYPDLWIDLKVKKAAEMKEPGVWGDEYCDNAGCHIEVLAAENYPPNFPKSKIREHQRATVLHECLHILFTSNGVPDDFQDKLIGLMLPLLQGKALK